ncbi:MAG: nucleotidyltransferase family protein [Anaerolineae bacterium]
MASQWNEEVKSKDIPDVQRFIEILHSALPSLAEHYSVKSLAVFGSYVRNEQRPDSDLDVLVEFEQTPTLFDLVHLADELSENLGVQVDLVPKQGLRRTIGKHILAEAVPV